MYQYANAFNQDIKRYLSDDRSRQALLVLTALRPSRPRNQRGSPLAPFARVGPFAISDLLADRGKSLGVIRP